MDRCLKALVSAACAVLLTSMNLGAATEAQHREWARKFETTGGSSDGRVATDAAVRTQVDLRQLLRCQGLKPEHIPAPGADEPC